MLPHPLKIFKIQKYYQNEPKFYGVYSRNNLPKAKDGGICNESWRDKSIMVIIYVFTALELNIFQRNLKIHRKKKYHNKFLLNTRIQFDNVWILLYQIYWCYVKILLNYRYLFSPNEYEKNDKIILKYFH